MGENDARLRKWEEQRFSGKTDTYWYTQTKESICVRIPMKRKGTRAKDLDIIIGNETLKVRDRISDTVLCEGTFPSKFLGAGKPKGPPLRVRKDDSMWTLAEDTVTLDLEKGIAEFWHSLFEGERKEAPAS